MFKILKWNYLIMFIILILIMTIPFSYAKYTESFNKRIVVSAVQPTYNVTFDANGGTGNMSSQSFTYGTNQTLNSNLFTRSGYKFMGWNTNSSGTGTSYTNMQSVLNLSSVNGDTVILYAQWMRVMAENVEYYENEVNCSDVQCMIDELYYMLY